MLNMLKDFMKQHWWLLAVSLVAMVVGASMIVTGPPIKQSIQPVVIVDTSPVTVHQVVIIKGDGPQSLQATVNQMLRDSSFVNVHLDYVSLPKWDVVMISHDVQVDE